MRTVSHWQMVFKEYEAAARGLKIQLQSLGVRGAEPRSGWSVSNRGQRARGRDGRDY